MLTFKTITLDDKDWIDPIVFAENSRSADFNFGNIYIWNKYYKQLVARSGERMITKLRYGGSPAFAFPVGSGDLRRTVLELKEFADSRGYPLRIYGVEEKNVRLLEELFPGQFEYTLCEDASDYVYEAEKLSTYAGKAMHGKKNHCNRFEAEHEGWQFVPITRELIPACMDMLSCWQEENAGRLEGSIAYEHDAIVRAFAAYEKLKLDGGALLHGGRILGFSVGELCSEDCFNVHFEKADVNINGAYPIVCREMTKLAVARHPSVRYINREDDMGIPALRTSKLSYKPAFMIHKYIAKWI